MEATDLAAKAGALRALHHEPAPLVLPNAWDVASAGLFEEAGFPAIATTSGGVAAALGYPDGEAIPATEMLGAVARIARAVSVPVTADLEAGYGLSPQDLVAALLETGAVGMNHEDTDHARGTLRAPDEQAAKIAEIKEAGLRQGVDVVLNARVDVYLRRRDDAPEDQIADAIARGRAYHDAGADCVFPILCRTDAIEPLVRAIDAPVNVFARPGVPDIARLAEIGVARISFGSGLMHVALEQTKRAAQMLRGGTFPWE
jgi:2-methylisocitrate lyase-like PEP mutase family enzyme